MLSAAEFLRLVAGRRGHFLLESGYHSNLWLDLDSLFADHQRVLPFVDALTDALKPYNADVVCGPLLGGAFLAQLIAGNLGARFCFTERVMPAERAGLYQAQYRLPKALTGTIAGQRIAIVDDVMSAGSALRGTLMEIEKVGGTPVVAGALLVLGSRGVEFFAERSLSVEAVARDEFATWLPADCPLCAEDALLEVFAADP